MIKVQEYYIDIESLTKLDSTHMNLLLDFYHQMMDAHRNGETDRAQAYFNTLDKSGLLKNKITEDRDNKINAING